MATHTLRKRERLCSMKLTDRLFNGAGSHSMAAFPVRVVWMEKEREDHESPVQVLVSVSKRHFKQAVKRNRVKRQLREAYRLSKQLLYDKLEQVPQRAVVIAFIWLSDELYSTVEVTRCTEILMKRLTEKL